MPSCSKAKNPRGVEIHFIEESHRYFSVIDGREITYTSGTTFVESFFPKFDPDGTIAERCAKREGITVEELRKRWKDKGERSCVYGTRIHESMEDRLLGRKLRNHPLDDREKLVFETVERLSERILDNMEIVGIEKIIFDERLRLAGTIDLLARSKKNGRLYILDHKTNERIDTENKYRSFALEPITNVPNTNYGHYMMQLNLYSYLLRESGYVDADENIGMCLFHITERGSETISIPKRQKEIVNMIETYKRRNSL